MSKSANDNLFGITLTELVIILFFIMLLLAMANIEELNERIPDNEEDVVPASAFRSDFAVNYGVKQIDGPLQGLTARAVVVIDEKGVIIYSQLVGEIADEPDYDAAIASLS